MTEISAAHSLASAERPAKALGLRIALAIVGATYAALFAALLHTPGRYSPLALAAISTLALFGLIAMLARARMSTRLEATTILGGGGALQLIALTTGPSTSDDVYRYVWDAKVQLHGIDPYAYAPQSSHLAALRDSTLFGPTSTCLHAIPGGCTAINRPSVHTIYPPVAQGLFDVVQAVSFGHGSVRPFQIAAALGVMAVTVLLLAVLHRRGRALWPAALWAWSPLVVIEYGNNGHIDWAAVLLGLGCVLVTTRRRSGWTGILLGAATLIKLYPLLLMPAVARRHPRIVIGAAAAVGVLAYLPHVLAAGTDVIGYLPGYLHEEGYDSGNRSLLLGLVFPHPLDTVAGIVVMIGVAVWCWRRMANRAPEHAATIVIGSAFVVATPSYGWYAGLLLALVVLTARYEWLPIVFAPTLVYLVRTEITHADWPGSTIYGLAVAAMVTIVWMQRRPQSSDQLADRPNVLERAQ